MDEGSREAVLSWIERELRKRGFEVKRGAVVEHEGFKHRVDILAETTLLGSVRLSIAFLVFDRKVDVEALERAIAWKDVLGLDKVVAVAIAGMDRDVAALALKKGVDIVYAPEHVLKVVHVGQVAEGAWIHVEPKANVEEAIEALEELARGGIFRRGRAKIAQVALLYLPIATYRVELRSSEGEVIEGVVSVDGFKGFPIYRKGKGIEIGSEEGSLTELDPNAVALIKALAQRESSSSTLGELAEELGVEPPRLSELVEQLASRGLIDVYGDVVELRGLDLARFVNVESLAKEVGASIHLGAPSEGVGRASLPIATRLANMESLIEALGGKVLEAKVAYYPLYVALVTESRNGVVKEKLVAVDGLSLEKVEGFDALGSDPDVIEEVKRCGDLRSSQA